MPRFFLFGCTTVIGCSTVAQQESVELFDVSSTEGEKPISEMPHETERNNTDMDRIRDDLIRDSNVEFVPLIGAIIPEFGSPRTMESANEVLEGIRVALNEYEKGHEQLRPPELVVLPDGDDLGRIMSRTQGAYDSHFLGVVVPSQDVLTSITSRDGDFSVPIISLNTNTVGESSGIIVSISDSDPTASRVLASQAITSGLRTAAIVHSRDQASTFEAETFTLAFQELGGVVLGKFEYPMGSTFFEEQLKSVESVLPDLLFLPLPSQDVELVAPQVTFFGLDSLGIRVFGTAAWSQEEILELVDTRHTDGVISASPYPAGEWSSAYLEFVDTYEQLYQRTLPSPSPSFGHDAASLLLETIGKGARTPEELLEVLDEITDLPGATGILSIADRKVVRKHFVTCLQDRVRTPISPYEQAQPILMPPLPDPETDSIPEDAPDRIMGFTCSQSNQ